jgi:maleate cis-trans isomerase
MVAPPEVTIHSQRLWLADEGSGESGIDQMNAEVPTAARYLATAEVHGIVYGCTTGSFYKGVGADLALIGVIEKAAGVPATCTSCASVEALRCFGARRVSVATPYPEWNNGKLRGFLEASGFTVLNLEAEPWAFDVPGRMIGDREPEAILEFASRVCRPGADALFCACTAWRSLEVVDQLEKQTGKPVITANQATIWAIFRKIGITAEIRGFGRLLENLATASLGA